MQKPLPTPYWWQLQRLKTDTKYRKSAYTKVRNIVKSDPQYYSIS